MGSNFVRHIYHKYPSYGIYNLDVLTYAGNEDNLLDIENKEAPVSPAERRYHFLRGDVCDALFLERIFNKYNFQFVVHFAAETHVDRSIFNFSDFVRTNIDGTRALMEAARRHSVPRFIHISTDEVYGNVPEGFSHEDTPLRPSNPYSASKAGADLLVQAMMKTYKIPAIIIRGSNNFGPYQYPEKLIPMAISNLIEGKKIPIHGSGGHVRSWIHVEDFCRAVDLIMHKAPDYAVYNVAGDLMTNLQVLKLIADELKKNLDDHKEHTADRPSADSRYAVDSSKLKSELGWSRIHSPHASMASVVDWYLTNKNWWQKIKSKKEYLDHYEKQSKAQWY